MPEGPSAVLGWIAWDVLSFGGDACLDFSLPCRMNPRSLLSAWAALLVVTVRHQGQCGSPVPQNCPKKHPVSLGQSVTANSVSLGLEGWEHRRQLCSGDRVH